MKEIWTPIKGFDNYGYVISSLGRIRNKHGREIKSVDDGKGYRAVGLHALNGHNSCRVHRLVAETYLWNPCGYQEVNHKNGNKADNRVENLEWCNRKQNSAHAKEGRKYEYAEAHHGVRLTEKQVLQIRAEYVPRKVSGYKLAEKYGVTQSAISNIINRKNWTHL